MKKKFETIKEWIITGLILIFSPILFPILCLYFYLAPEDWWYDDEDK